MTTTVVNKNKEDYDVLIQNGTKWKNPYLKDTTKNRKEKIEAFEIYFLESINSGKITREDLLGLKGKKLGCSCKPLPCHGDIIANYINEEFSPLSKFLMGK